VFGISCTRDRRYGLDSKSTVYSTVCHVHRKRKEDNCTYIVHIIAPLTRIRFHHTPSKEESYKLNSDFCT
jgi:hypothetical protein